MISQLHHTATSIPSSYSLCSRNNNYYYNTMKENMLSFKNKILIKHLWEYKTLAEDG